MHALVKGAMFAAGLATLGLFASRMTKKPAPPPVAAASATAPDVPIMLTQMPCPERHLPEGQACIPLPALDEPLDATLGGPQKERRTRGPAVEVIPRLPDRSEDPYAYAYPLPDEPLFLRGFDDRVTTDASPVSLELAAERGAPVKALAFEDQEGPTLVAAVDRMIGTTVVTLHRVLAGDRSRRYLLVHGHLDAASPEVKAGKELRADDVVGFVGDSGNPGIVSLYLEARLVREDAVLDGLSITQLLEAAVSVPTDARNVLPLK